MPLDNFSTHPLAQELVKWLVQNGGSISDDVNVVYSESHGFHMRAVRPLSTPTVASCPLRLTLSILNLDPNEKEVLHVPSSLQQCHAKIPDHTLTYLFLIEQRKKGKDSPWHAYISCLPGPGSMTTPLWFDENDLSFLAGTNLAPAARERKEELHKQWERAVHVMVEQNIALANEVDFESLLWAATIFTSRAFISTHILVGRETIPLLFPVVDILNHSATAKVEWDFQSHVSFTLKCLEGETFTAGDEILNNYAPKQNGELLLGYGFCLDGNPIEQFALKLAFPPVLQEYAQETGLLKASSVPFGMTPDFLETDPNIEQHFLRPRGHAFGRYENAIPFFRGIPPYIIHLFFVQTMLELDLDIREINIARPSARITLQILVLLHHAIEQRCSTLPLTTTLKPTNQKQRFAKTYRDAQAAIIHSIRHELVTALTHIRPPPSQITLTPPPQTPLLLCIPTALATLSSTFPAAAATFKNGLTQHDLHSPRDDIMIWPLLLSVLAALLLTTPPTPTHSTPSTILPSWLHDLATRYPLPSLDDGVEDAETYTFLDAHLRDFLSLASGDAEASPSDVLDDLGLTLGGGERLGEGTFAAVFVGGPTENLGVRVLMWAMEVAAREVLPVFEEGGVRKCLYVRAWREGGDEEREDEGWMYEEGV